MAAKASSAQIVIAAFGKSFSTYWSFYILQAFKNMTKSLAFRPFILSSIEYIYLDHSNCLLLNTIITDELEKIA